MTKMFGPDRKWQLWAVPVDERTVLLASATSDQLAAAIDTLRGNRGSAWDAGNVAESNRLLPSSADLRLFASPAGYTKWERQLMEAMTGGLVIGAPTARTFLPTPPIGLAIQSRGDELWIDGVIPASTVSAGILFLNRP
jgi:hypothetical protein